MNLKHLEFFLEVAQCGSINKAAQKLYTSQPYISYVIRDLENYVGYPLFLRSQKGVSLTEEGKAFWEHAQVVMQGMETLKSLSSKQPIDSDQLNISITKFSHPMESFIYLCRQRHQLSNFAYRLNEGSLQEVLQEVVAGIADLGVLHYGSHMQEEMTDYIAANDLELLPLGHFPPHIIISKNHELIQQNKEVTLSSLQEYGLVRFIGESEDFVFDLVSDRMPSHLNKSPKIVYVYGRAASLHLISSSNFYTIGIQEFATQDSMYQIISVPIEACEKHLVFGIVMAKNKVLSGSAKEFINHLTDNFSSIKSK